MKSNKSIVLNACMASFFHSRGCVCLENGIRNELCFSHNTLNNNIKRILWFSAMHGFSFGCLLKCTLYTVHTAVDFHFRTHSICAIPFGVWIILLENRNSLVTFETCFVQMKMEWQLDLEEYLSQKLYIFSTLSYSYNQFQTIIALHCLW